MSNVVVEERLNENDSCGGTELHDSPIVDNQCKDEKVNVDVPYVEKQEEQLRSMVVLPSQLKKIRTTMERKPSKFKVSPYIHQSNKMRKSKRFQSIVVGSKKVVETILMSILLNMEDSYSLSSHESLVVAYVFDVSLDKIELLVNFQYEHANREDFMTLGSSQELLDVIINVFACKLNTFEKKIQRNTTHRMLVTHYICGIKLSNSTKIFTHIIKHIDEMKDCDKVEECAHFFNLNGHDKNLSSFPIERPTWVHVQDNG
ncbi:hypothetical protein CK203_009051 [Vitis vinifera]|uniref:Uncharacterized protein n=1 Tax=Vitis vinifera TaxID=29760 RepID=A0A438K2M9_VITVI|nr:hypothetical protein CK203_009051 [Vitis vinifera]